VLENIAQSIRHVLLLPLGILLQKVLILRSRERLFSRRYDLPGLLIDIRSTIFGCVSITPMISLNFIGNPMLYVIIANSVHSAIGFVY